MELSVPQAFFIFAGSEACNSQGPRAFCIAGQRHGTLKDLGPSVLQAQRHGTLKDLRPSVLQALEACNSHPNQRR